FGSPPTRPSTPPTASPRCCTIRAWRVISRRRPRSARGARPVGRKKRGRPISGWLVLDKPEGVSATRATGRVRRLFERQQAGHAGTLAPLASGILPIALGEATKTVAYALDGRKTYSFTAAWGEARETDDREGRVIAESPVRPDEAAI